MLTVLALCQESAHLNCYTLLCHCIFVPGVSGSPDCHKVELTTRKGPGALTNAPESVENPPSLKSHDEGQFNLWSTLERS